MQLELTDIELEIIRRALRAAIDLGDLFYTFCPDTNCGGAKVYYGSGDLDLEEKMAEHAVQLQRRLRGMMTGETLIERQTLMKEMSETLGRQNQKKDPTQPDIFSET